MLILDEQRLERNARGAAHEATQEQARQCVLEALEDAEIVDPLRETALNPERQRGHSMTAEKLESVLHELSPNFWFEVIGQNLLKKRLWYTLPDGTPYYVCAYENGVMPEWSVRHGKYEWAPDYAQQLAPLRGDRNPVTNQAAFNLIQKHGVNGAVREALKQRPFDPTDKPGFKRVLRTWSEAIRGWRTVLANVLRSDLGVPLYKIENVVRHYGTPDRLSWALRVGNADVRTKAF